MKPTDIRVQENFSINTGRKIDFNYRISTFGRQIIQASNLGKIATVLSKNDCVETLQSLVNQMPLNTVWVHVCCPLCVVLTSVSIVLHNLV